MWVKKVGYYFSACFQPPIFVSLPIKSVVLVFFVFSPPTPEPFFFVDSPVKFDTFSNPIHIAIVVFSFTLPLVFSIIIFVVVLDIIFLALAVRTIFFLSKLFVSPSFITLPFEFFTVIL